jgi:hypothetical protein
MWGTTKINGINNLNPRISINHSFLPVKFNCSLKRNARISAAGSVHMNVSDVCVRQFHSLWKDLRETKKGMGEGGKERD